MIPGQYLLEPGEIELNAGRPTVVLTVSNTGDRPIQVGSHYHFAETNPALQFDRAAARGYRLDIAAGTAVRFEPGQSRTVALVALAGTRTVYGFRQQVMGPLERRRRAPRADTEAPGKRAGKSATGPARKVATRAEGKSPAKAAGNRPARGRS